MPFDSDELFVGLVAVLRTEWFTASGIGVVDCGMSLEFVW